MNNDKTFRTTKEVREMEGAIVEPQSPSQHVSVSSMQTKQEVAVPRQQVKFLDLPLEARLAMISSYGEPWIIKESVRAHIHARIKSKYPGDERLQEEKSKSVYQKYAGGIAFIVTQPKLSANFKKSCDARIAYFTNNKNEGRKPKDSTFLLGFIEMLCEREWIRPRGSSVLFNENYNASFMPPYSDPTGELVVSTHYQALIEQCYFYQRKVKEKSKDGRGIFANLPVIDPVYDNQYVSLATGRPLILDREKSFKNFIQSIKGEDPAIIVDRARRLVVNRINNLLRGAAENTTPAELADIKNFKEQIGSVHYKGEEFEKLVSSLSKSQYERMFSGKASKMLLERVFSKCLSPDDIVAGIHSASPEEWFATNNHFPSEASIKGFLIRWQFVDSYEEHEYQSMARILDVRFDKARDPEVIKLVAKAKAAEARGDYKSMWVHINGIPVVANEVQTEMCKKTAFKHPFTSKIIPVLNSFSSLVLNVDEDYNTNWNITYDDICPIPEKDITKFLAQNKDVREKLTHNQEAIGGN